MERTCLYCGISEAEVIATRNREGYTLGCGIERSTESGLDYEELSERHRWADWKDAELDRMGIKPEAYEKHRRSTIFNIQWAACDDTKRGHAPATYDDVTEMFANYTGQCIACGKDTRQEAVA